MTGAQPYTTEELEQVRQRAEMETNGESLPYYARHADVPRLLATLAENDKAFYAAIAPLHATIRDLRAQLTASHNAALERAAGVCEEKSTWAESMIEKHDADAIQFGTISNTADDCAQAIRALMTKE